MIADRKRLNDGLYGLFTDGGSQLWSRVRLRKPTECEECGAKLGVGDAAYSPITNANNRAHRICPPCVEVT